MYYLGSKSIGLNESELNDSLLGTLAKQMVNHSKIPVLSIKPKEGIYTPYSPV
jgi:hypothetical protein